MESKEKSKPQVCVIGAGVGGIVSVKACVDAGFKVSCFDKSPTYGGLWCYHDDTQDLNGDFIPSVMKTTILNTSKELSAFSDFPPPANLPNFMKHDLYMDYIRSYVDHNKLSAHMKLRHEVLHCEPEFDSTQGTLKWSIDIRDVNENRQFNQKFDKLMIAVGHHNIPYAPTFPDQHKFKGQILHTVRVKDILNDQRFIDKRVVVVGFGNSACDAANDLALVAKKCYVSTHRGNWFIQRLTPSGPYDFKFISRWNYYRSGYLPTSLIDKRIIKLAEKRINHQSLGLEPKHMPSEQIPAINDLFPYRVFTGGVILKGTLLKFTESGVVFEGEEDCEYEADVVILATGYAVKLPFLNEIELGIKSAELNEFELYMNMFSPKLSIPSTMGTVCPEAIKSLAFIGFVQPSGSITVISELQARLATLVFDGKCELPSAGEMIEDIQRVRRRRAVAIRSHSQDQLVGSWIGYSDLIASRIGVKPNLSHLFFKDFALWKRLMFGPSVPYQYRLSGPGHWPKAREAVLTVDERMFKGINEGKNDALFKSRRKCLGNAADKNKTQQDKH